MKKCEYVECGCFSTEYKNNCSVLEDLTYSGCTCDFQCEAFKTNVEAELLEIVLKSKLPNCSIETIKKRKKEYKKIKAMRERMQNEKQNA